MRYAFAIDHKRCIGCHACTVACKEEHDVPIGVNRTWVKYIEKGTFPDTRRHFAVLRCNQCADAPCVTICPTVALYKRDDGIVDFDSDRCIGCKSCMQACPYDALYINPDTNTAAKCNFCAHRVENHIQPACEIVCPVQAITSGDLDDPSSPVSRVVSANTTTVRKPEKSTRPQVYYVGVEEDLLQPTRIRTSDAHMWADKYPGEDFYYNGGSWETGTTAREVYDVPHPMAWGWKIAAYLWTKSIAAGASILATLAYFMVAEAGTSQLLNVVLPAVAIVFTAVTTFLLVIDLKRPERFHYLLFKPNPRSWLVIGGYILMAYGALSALWLVMWIATGAVPMAVVVVTGIFGAAAAGYSAALFHQAKGRDLWQSPMFFWHLLLQAPAAGAAITIVLGFALGSTAPISWIGRILFASTTGLLALTLIDVIVKGRSEEYRRAHDIMVAGTLRRSFWALAFGAGMLLPAVITGSAIWGGATEPIALISASVLSLVGLWFYEDVWVRAGQAVPLS